LIKSSLKNEALKNYDFKALLRMFSGKFYVGMKFSFFPRKFLKRMEMYEEIDGGKFHAFSYDNVFGSSGNPPLST
jgi:hypothetical protein